MSGLVFSGIGNIIDVINYRYDDSTLRSLMEPMFPLQETLVITCRTTEKLCDVGEYIQLDGVLFEIISSSENKFEASTTLNLIEHTTITEHRQKMVIGRLIKDTPVEKSWPLCATSIGQITCVKVETIVGHRTLKAVFEADLKYRSIIREDHHIGISGCSLTVKELFVDDVCIRFSIYCGKQTQEVLSFDNVPMKFNLNVPFD